MNVLITKGGSARRVTKPLDLEKWYEDLYTSTKYFEIRLNHNLYGCTRKGDCEYCAVRQDGEVVRGNKQ